MSKLYAGCYRLEAGLTFTAYAHIVRVGREWHATIRHATHGDTLRHAGRWATLREATSEARDLLWRDYLTPSAAEALAAAQAKRAEG